MLPERVGYVPPCWAHWLHHVPHVSLRFQAVDDTFRPQDEDYQQSLLFLACVAAAGLGLTLLALAVYLSCLCCCRTEDEEDETKKPNSCCVTWTAVTAGLLCCVAVGVGFYGNSETNDGVYQLTYSLYNANHTLAGVENLVTGTVGSMQSGLKAHLSRLDEIFATRQDFVQTLQFTQKMSDNVVKQLLGLPDWQQTKVNLATLAERAAFIEYYRWLTYMLILILDLVVCLAACLGLAKQSRCLLTTMMVFGVLILILSWASLGADLATAVGVSDFCVSPDKFIMNQTKDVISYNIVQYYLLCSQTLSNPFQQSLTVFQRSLTTMQVQVQGLLQFAVPLFPTAKRDLMSIQHLLNSSETSLHQLTALLDCRGLNKDYLDALMGVCYDGVEGMLYLCVFSLLAAAAFCTMLCAIPRAWRQITTRQRGYDDVEEEDPFNLRTQRVTPQQPHQGDHGNLHTFCSYNSSMGSQISLHPAAAPPTSNTPVTEYMNQSAVFGGTPRYENVPLIGRGSPPPSPCRNRYSPSMRATYLSMTEDQMRHFGEDFRA
ncbi:protein tweety homolog 2 isoform X2 [Electrophorus electricus]|uniref:protein tweety homolog 2 isoform X2 n=1 Tax=Electrophorus electricus TaxID=8005 RepID=UPI0015D03DDA|nr:protein tweety homolog 2 isoform X2 [Electrophorus electricus]